MHAPTHIMSGWCVGNLFRLTAGERACCMIAASAADVDAVSRVFGEEAYWDWHHVAGHNLLFAVLLAAGLAVFSRHRLKALLVYLALAHLHLVLDYFGSGPGWAIRYGWPLFQWDWQNAEAWEFSAWQNRVAALVLLVWVLGIAVVRGRTPVELLTPDLDRRIVARLRRWVGWRAVAPAANGMS
jgi:inner membrane protein